MNHKGTLELKTERLTLRQFKNSDAEKMFFNWANDNSVTRYLPWETHSSIDVTTELLQNWCSCYNDLSFYQWGIEFNNDLIGSISVIDIDETNNSCEIGYCIGKKWWNKGITTEALRSITSFLLNDVNMNKLWAWHHIDNTNSGKVLSHCGFKLVRKEKDDAKYMNTTSSVLIYELNKESK